MTPQFLTNENTALVGRDAILASSAPDAEALAAAVLESATARPRSDPVSDIMPYESFDTIEMLGADEMFPHFDELGAEEESEAVAATPSPEAGPSRKRKGETIPEEIIPAAKRPARCRGLLYALSYKHWHSNHIGFEVFRRFVESAARKLLGAAQPSNNQKSVTQLPEGVLSNPELAAIQVISDGRLQELVKGSVIPSERYHENMARKPWETKYLAPWLNCMSRKEPVALGFFLLKPPKPFGGMQLASLKPGVFCARGFRLRKLLNLQKALGKPVKVRSTGPNAYEVHVDCSFNRLMRLLEESPLGREDPILAVEDATGMQNLGPVPCLKRLLKRSFQFSVGRDLTDVPPLFGYSEDAKIVLEALTSFPDPKRVIVVSKLADGSCVLRPERRGIGGLRALNALRLAEEEGLLRFMEPQMRATVDDYEQASKVLAELEDAKYWTGDPAEVVYDLFVTYSENYDTLVGGLDPWDRRQGQTAALIKYLLSEAEPSTADLNASKIEMYGGDIRIDTTKSIVPLLAVLISSPSLRYDRVESLAFHGRHNNIHFLHEKGSDHDYALRSHTTLERFNEALAEGRLTSETLQQQWSIMLWQSFAHVLRLACDPVPPRCVRLAAKMDPRKVLVQFGPVEQPLIDYDQLCRIAQEVRKKSEALPSSAARKFLQMTLNCGRVPPKPMRLKVWRDWCQVITTQLPLLIGRLVDINIPVIVEQLSINTYSLKFPKHDAYRIAMQLRHAWTSDYPSELVAAGLWPACRAVANDYPQIAA